MVSETPEKKLVEIHKICTSAAPRLDALAARYIASNTKQGVKMFLNARKAESIFWTGDSMTPPAGCTPHLWREEGVLYLGRGGPGVLFDEHPGEGRPNRLSNTCTISLMADYLGVRDSDKIAPVVDAILAEDIKANSGTNSLPAVAKHWHMLHPTDPARIYPLVSQACEALFDDERGVTFSDSRSMLGYGNIFDAIAWCHRKRPDKQVAQEWMQQVFAIHDAAQAAFEDAYNFYTADKVVREVLPVRLVQKGGKKRWRQDYSVVSILSDDPYMSKVVRYHWKKVAVIIVQNSKGQVQILPSRNLSLKMTDVLTGIRLEEQERRGNVKTTDWNDLKADGEVPGCTNWFYFNGMIFNASLTAPDVEPTAIPINAIERLVVEGLDVDLFPENRSEKCKGGICTHKQNRCPWHRRAYSKCRTIRYEESQKNKAGRITNVTSNAP